MSVRIKICGITSRHDAETAVRLGADALGFIFVPESPRLLTMTAAAGIIDALPPFVARVAVTANAAEGTIRQMIQTCGFDTIQLHGEEPPAFCARFEGVKVVKAFRVGGGFALSRLEEYRTVTDGWLLDAYAAGKLGGTGETFDWAVAREAAALGHPLILAGGLNAANVGDAVRTVNPYGVDVSSGVEAEPGRKDPQKLADFIRGVRNARSRDSD